MSDIYTGTGDVSTVTTAYEQLAYFDLRDQLYFQAAADVKPTLQTHRGSTVQWTINADVADAITPLTEDTDLNSVGLTDTTVSVTLQEYGNAVLVTRKLEELSFFDVVADAANRMGYNAGRSVDTLARDVLAAGDNVIYSDFTDPSTNSARNQVGRAADTTDGDDTLSSDNVRRAVATLRGNNSMPFGTHYGAFIHPDISADLRAETGGAAWTDPANFSAANRRWVGLIGAYEGAMFTEAPRAPIFAAAGLGGADVYGTIFVGQQGLACGYSAQTGETPEFVVGPITDKLRRHRPLGWYWLGGYTRFREESIVRVESVSSTP